MFEIDFSTFDHNFCESTIYSMGQHPEYLNTLSSFFMTFIGISGLMKPYNYMIISMAYSFLAINGVLSASYHYYNSIGWGLMDRMSMIILALNTHYLYFPPIRNFISTPVKNALYIILATYYTTLLTVAGLHKEDMFNLLFAAFLASIAVVTQLLVNTYNIPANIANIGWKGVKYIVYSGIFWVGTEALCHHFYFIKYLFGHVWWHFFVSLGGYYISIIPKYIHMKINGNIVLLWDKWGLPYLDYLDTTV